MTPRRVLLLAAACTLALTSCAKEASTTDAATPVETVAAVAGPDPTADSATDSAADPATAAAEGLRRADFLEVICGIQYKAHGEGAAPNEVVRVRIQEQVEGGVDISREVVADADGVFLMQDYCDPESPNAEVPALWSYEGVTSGKTGSDLVTYKLAPATLATTAAASTETAAG